MEVEVLALFTMGLSVSGLTINFGTPGTNYSRSSGKVGSPP